VDDDICNLISQGGTRNAFVCQRPFIKYMMFQKEFFNGIPNATVWRLLRKRLNLKQYQLSAVLHLERNTISAFKTARMPGPKSD
jgi:hypothetical protein